ncbi:penicillin amidase [Enhydrobacter aerosaccus]|uniref:Penicillin amidase n=1 Tax=Enhydrobacter aerosaccus TaxID=225324 RepID=A0A1T4SPW6_9HYPH|nr:penicillin acylase family protein [Enhydrobacter aerosaccus]SKA30227.1 penicillin amidase [Enhydrobacter aerosaccus]
MLPLDNAPVQRAVEIRWNDHAVPFIEAESSHDLAVAIGLVHAHLRLGQIEIMRRLSRGRVSEMVGSAAIELDHTLRLIDFAQAVPTMMQRLPSATRDWLEGFVAGLNHVLAREPLPHEFALFALEREPWSVADVLTLGRLAGFDNNWLVWLRLLARGDGGRLRPELWQRIVAELPSASTSLDALTAAAHIVNNRSGSNAVVVGAGRGGSSWIASDPHLSLGLPSNWLTMGYRAPGHCAVGFMIPGLPFLAMGRNEAIAWGGTSLHSYASELCDVSDRPPESFRSREEIVKVRWGRPRTLTTRRCEIGPLLSDSRFFRRLDRPAALRWIGHDASDEVTAMLQVSTARSWQAFKRALEAYAVPGLNMMYADVDGHVGQALACWLPEAIRSDPHLVSAEQSRWQVLRHAGTLPDWFDPPEGYAVSANEQPEVDLAVGRFFSPRGRKDRITSLIEAAGAIDFGALSALQRDVQSQTARRLAHLLAKAARAANALPRRAATLITLLEDWDGSYDADSKAAAIFERLLTVLARRLYAAETLAAYSATWALRDLILADLDTMATDRLAPIVRQALIRLSRTVGTSWGELHRLRLQYPLGQLPIVGRRYRLGDLPTGGGSDTVMKMANGLISGRHTVGFGSNARHISNLADSDDNHFVLLGGQDGWFGSVNFADQVPLWQRGAYIRLPLSPPAVRAAFPHVLRVRPAGT